MRVLHVASAYGYWGALHPNCLDVEDKGQVGGGETAMLYAAFELAARGHDVTCAFRCKPQKYRGVTFHPTADIETLLYDEDWDAIVSWDNVEPLLPLQGEGIRLICSNQMNGISPLAQHNQEILFVSPSRTHARLMHHRYGIPLEHFSAIPNAVDPSWYDFGATRNPFSVMYASSPDRGLHHLLQLWPQIRTREPRAELHVYYEISRWLSMCESIPYIAPEMAGLAKMIRRFRYSLDASDGVFWEGAVHPRQVARDMCRAGVLAYPCETIFFTEGFGTTPMQAHIAGMRVILSDTDAFPDVYGSGPGLDEPAGLPLVGSAGEANPLIPRTEIPAEFAPRVVEAMRSMVGREGWAWSSPASARQLADRYSWTRVGAMWEEVIRGERVWWPEGKWTP